MFSALAFVATTLLFGLLSAAMRTRRTEPKIPVLTMIVMNIATAITFLSFYASISMIPAATSGALESAFGPSDIAVLSFLTARAVPSRAQWITAITLVALGIFLAARTEYDSVTTGTTALGALLAVIAGWEMTAVTLLSRSLGGREIGPVTLTAHRIHAGYLAAISIWATSNPQLSAPGDVLLLLGPGVLATGISLFLYKSECSGPNRSQRC